MEEEVCSICGDGGEDCEIYKCNRCSLAYCTECYESLQDHKCNLEIEIIDAEMENLKEGVRELLDEVNKTHRYNFSRIYNTYNKVFNTNETPTKATSALVRKVKVLRLWLGEREKKESLQNLMLEFSEHDSYRMPNNGEKRTIPDNNWEALAEAIITLLTSAE